MFYLVAIGLFPALLILIAPLGLAVINWSCRFTRGLPESFKEALAPVMGLAVLITGFGLALHLGVPAAVLLPGAVALNVIAASYLWRRRPPIDWKGLARMSALAFAVYLVLISPVLKTGHFGVTGYNVSNDPVVHSTLADYLNINGYRFPDKWPAGFTSVAVDKLVYDEYPDGWHYILLLASRIFGLRAFALFNFTEAFFMALLAPVIYAWLRQLNVDRGWSIFGGLVAGTGFLQLSYVTQGFAAQAAINPFIYACLLIFYKLVAENRREFALPAGLLLQASLAVYSFTAFIWLSVFIVIVAGLTAVSSRSFRIRAGAVSALLGVVIAAAINPFSIFSMVGAWRMVMDDSKVGGSMGNLVSAHVPILPVFGFWSTGDHRLAPVGMLHVLSYIFAAVALLVVAWALLRVRTDRNLLWGGLATMFITAVALKVAAGPYFFAKTIQIAAPMAAAALTAGLYHMRMRGGVWRGAGLLLAALYAIGVAGSDAYIARLMPITPHERFAELSRISDRFKSPSIRLGLYYELNEDWGKYLLSDLKVVTPLTRAYGGAVPPMRASADTTRVLDLDNIEGVLGKRFDLIVIERKQDISLAPPPFEQVFTGRFYNVYKKVSGPVPTRHRPFEKFGESGDAYRQLEPGESLTVSTPAAFESILVAGYSLSGGAFEPTVFSVRDLSVIKKIGRRPAVYLLDFSGPEKASLTIKNTGSSPVRLDWFELFDKKLSETKVRSLYDG